MSYNHRRAFSLIEALSAALIFAIGVGAVLFLWTQTERMNLRSKQVSLATQLARSDLERARALGFSNLPTGSKVTGSSNGTWTGNTEYYDAFGNASASTTTRFFKLVRDINDSNVLQNNTDTSYRVYDQTTRIVRTRVWLVSNGDELVNLGTNFVSGGL